MPAEDRRQNEDSPMFDYRCGNGHPFAAPGAEHGGPWSTLVCSKCGATAFRESCGCDHIDDPSYDGLWCGYCDPRLGGDEGSGDV